MTAWMLCRNTVRDFDRWREVFSSHAEAHREAGLELENVWRDREDPNDVFFVFRVENLEAARAFISAPDGARAAERAGVLAGEIRILESAEGY